MLLASIVIGLLDSSSPEAEAPITTTTVEEAAPTIPALDLGAFGAKCRPYVELMRAAWMHHNPQWEAFFPGFVWQIALESGCKPDIVNSIGATGFGQLLKTAAKDCRDASLTGSRREAVFNLECSAWLQARTGRLFRAERTDQCRIVLVWIGHLTGAGHLVASQRVARKDGAIAVCWDDGIGAYLDQVISEENAEHAHWYARWISDRSGIATSMVNYRTDMAVKPR